MQEENKTKVFLNLDWQLIKNYSFSMQKGRGRTSRIKSTKPQNLWINRKYNFVSFGTQDEKNSQLIGVCSYTTFFKGTWTMFKESIANEHSS
jgi:hypothetical protein